MRGLLPIVTVIKFATENYKNLISKENFFENSSFFVIHLKNTKSGHVIFFSIFWYVTWPMFNFLILSFYPVLPFLPEVKN